MLLSTQISIGSNLVSEGTLLLQDAARQSGFSADGSMSSTMLASSIKHLEILLADLKSTHAALRENDKPVQLIAAE